MSTLEWHSVDFKTGLRGSKVAVTTTGTLSRVINLSSPATLKTPCSNNGARIPGWEEATKPDRSVMVAVDPDGDRIVWAGLVRSRPSNSGAMVDVNCDTIEAYFHRRYINAALSWTDADPTTVAVNALAQITDLPPLVVRSTLTGMPVVDGFYDETDNKSIGSLLGDLAGLSGGIEWTVEVEWVDADHTQAQYVVVIAPRIGTPAGVAATQWRMPGCVTDFQHEESGGAQWLANDVVALSSGEGGSKPRSTRYVADDLIAGGYARFESRPSPATNITSTQTLDQFAEAELAATRLGLNQLTLTANLDAAPRVNLDWWMGDDIDVSLTCDRFPAGVDSDGFETAGFEARLRTVGWDMDPDARTLKPRIMEAGA